MASRFFISPSRYANSSSSVECFICFSGSVSTNPEPLFVFSGLPAPEPLLRTHRSRSATAFGKRLQGDPQFLYCTKHCVLCRAAVGLEHRCNLLNSTSVPVAHDDRGSLSRSKGVQGRFHLLGHLGAGG